MTSADKGSAKPVRISLLSRRSPLISPELATAEFDQLRAFVNQIREEYGFWWPAGHPGKGSTAWPWPQCWDRHAGFVSALRMLQSWHHALETGQVDGGHREVRDCLHYLRDDIGGMVRVISGRTCRYRHVDVTAEPRPREREPLGAPALPGRSPAVPPPEAPAPHTWRALFEPGADLEG